MTEVDLNGRQVDYRVDLASRTFEFLVKRTTNRRADAFPFSLRVARRRISFDSGAHAEEAEADPVGHRSGSRFLSTGGSDSADPSPVSSGLRFH